MTQGFRSESQQWSKMTGCKGGSRAMCIPVATKGQMKTGVGLEHGGTVHLHEVFRSLIQLFFSPVYNCPACLSKTLINLPAQQLTSVNILRLQLASANWAFRSSRIYNSVQLCLIPEGRSVYLSVQFHFLPLPVLIAPSYVNRAGEDLI